MGIRRRLFLLQAATLGIVTVGAVGGWGISRWIGQGPSQRAEQLALTRNHLAHMSFDMVGAVPHTGQYLYSSAPELTELLRADIRGLSRFRAAADAHLDGLKLASADPQLHRELETIRLLTVQLEQKLILAERRLQQARRQGRSLAPADLQSIVMDPSIPVIRRHGELLASLHDSVDDRYNATAIREHQALLLGVISWISLLLGAWVVGLLLAWRTGERLLQPLVKLEQLMRGSPQGLEEALQDPALKRAPEEIASLARSFEALVREVRQLLLRLEDQARTDGLTAVGNRRHFDAMFAHEWQRGVRSGAPLSLLLLDVDHFKQYNDVYGHVEGDRCLQQVAQAIRSQVRRNSDVVCRIGGEEFAILLPETAAPEAVRLAQGIVMALDAMLIEHASSPVAAWVTASIGVASCRPSPSLDPGTLMERADRALYVRKRRMGRHGITQADEISVDADHDPGEPAPQASPSDPGRGGSLISPGPAAPP